MTSYHSTVQQKGQLTIPVEVREKLALKPGDRLEFQVLRDGTALVRALNLTVGDLFGSIPYEGAPRSIEEIEDGISEGAAEGIGLGGRKPGGGA